MVARPIVLVLGGYGVFGSRVCQLLARDGRVDVIIAGRHADKAQAMAAQIRSTAPNTHVTAHALHMDSGLAEGLVATGASVVVNAAGPFQGQSYNAATCCINAGVPYVDLADGRRFVCDFSSHLDEFALTRGVLAVSGASTVPGLSSVVVDHLAAPLESLDSIAIAITPGNRAPRGLAVIQAILGYVGKPLPWWRKGQWGRVHGWQDLHRRTLAGIGKRWFSACDVPDLELFPRHFPTVQSVTFHAGLELAPMHLGLWLASWLVRWRLLDSLAPLSHAATTAARWLEPWGRDVGGMVVEVESNQWTRQWLLRAGSGHGPWIPAVPAAIVARKLALGELAVTGAMPCLGMFTLEEFMAEVAHLDISATVTETRPYVTSNG